MPFDYFGQKILLIDVNNWLLCIAHLKYILIRFNIQFDAFPKLLILFDFADLSGINMSFKYTYHIAQMLLTFLT